MSEAGELTRTHARVVVIDNGHDIVLRSYRGADLLATIELPPQRAVALAADLAQAASRHLSRVRDRRRGQRRAETTAGLLRGSRALQRLRNEHFGDLGISKAADEIAAEGRRYETTRWRADRDKPVAEIGDARSALYAEVLHGRNHFPGARRVRDLIREMNSTPIHFPKSGSSVSHDDLDQR